MKPLLKTGMTLLFGVLVGAGVVSMIVAKEETKKEVPDNTPAAFEVIDSTLLDTAKVIKKIWEEENPKKGEAFFTVQFFVRGDIHGHDKTNDPGPEHDALCGSMISVSAFDLNGLNRIENADSILDILNKKRKNKGEGFNASLFHCP